MLRSVFLIGLLILAPKIFSQNIDSLKWIYNNKAIYRYGSIFMKGTERLRFEDLENEFSFSPVGLDGFHLAKKYKHISRGLKIVTFAANVALVSFIASNKENAFYVGLGFQIALSLGGAYYNKLATQQTDKALWQRNKDLLFGK